MRINSWGKSNEVNSACIPSKQNQWHSPHEECCAPSPPRDLVWATDTYKERLHEAHTHFLKVFYVDYFLKVFIEFVPILLLFNVLGFCLQHLWDLSSPTIFLALKDEVLTTGLPRKSLHSSESKQNRSSSNICCCSVMSNSLWPHGLQHAGLPYLLELA